MSSTFLISCRFQHCYQAGMIFAIYMYIERYVTKTTYTEGTDARGLSLTQLMLTAG